MVDYLNGKEDAIQLFSSLADSGIAISIITYAELYEGILGSRAQQERAQQLEELLQTIDVLPIDFEVAQRFAIIRRDLRHRGQLIPDPDVFIAATALRHNLTLMTRDRHFQRVESLVTKDR
jgi:predicted nucleic acid-binding protein